MSAGSPGEGLDQRRYLGVDAGNSKTVAVLADGIGRVLGWGRGGCGDIYADTEESAVREVTAAVGAAMDTAMGASTGTAPGAPLSRAALCLAGVDWLEDVAYWRSEIATRMPALTGCSIRNDGFALLRAGAGDSLRSGVGVAISVGTGGAVVGRGPAGAEWSPSMWITHPAGGGDLGRAAMHAVVRAELGLAPATKLSGVLPAVHQLPDVAELLHQTSRRSPDVPVRHAHAARVVLAVAAEGDAVARGIVADQARALAGYVRVVAGRTGFTEAEPVPVVIGGSVGATPVMREAIIDALRLEVPRAEPRIARRAPVLGAVLEAIAEDGVPLDEQLVARLDAAELPDHLLRT